MGHPVPPRPRFQLPRVRSKHGKFTKPKRHLQWASLAHTPQVGLTLGSCKTPAGTVPASDQWATPYSEPPDPWAPKGPPSPKGLKAA